uniref:hypothetical protein n=1 Tax=Shewanella gaetbuli TaxID=220752 RepID=UPI003B5CA13C
MQVIGFILFTVYGFAHVVAGFIGIDFYFGVIGAGLAILAAVMVRFTLPLTVGAFFGAMDVWHWHWAFAALFAAPGLLLIIPSVIISIIDGVKK